MALALENPTRIVLLDDMLARRTAQAAGLSVWGTLKILLEAKKQGLTDKVEPFVVRLSDTGMWISDEIRQRILVLAGEESLRSKYDPLRNLLAGLPSSVTEKTLTFSAIENILGFRLPDSAYNHRQWWANPSSASDHPFAQAWLAAGWKVETVNQSEKWVRFQRG